MAIGENVKNVKNQLNKNTIEKIKKNIKKIINLLLKEIQIIGVNIKE